MPLKHWQAWGIDHLSRKPVPMFDHPLSKEMLPNVQSDFANWTAVLGFCGRWAGTPAAQVVLRWICNSELWCLTLHLWKCGGAQASIREALGSGLHELTHLRTYTARMPSEAMQMSCLSESCSTFKKIFCRSWPESNWNETSLYTIESQRKE